jgi:hypothetical protein
MALKPEKLEKRAIKAGIRAAKKRHHQLSTKELLQLKIQILPDTLRGFLIVAGGIMILLAALGWPLSADHHQVIMGLGGGLMIIAGAFGVRRSLGTLMDSGIEVVVEVILDAIGNAVDF